MSLVREAGGLRLRRGGEEFVLRDQAFLDRAQMTDDAAERSIESMTAAQLTGSSVHIHIHGRSPLRYTIRVAPLSHVPEADWWVDRG